MNRKLIVITGYLASGKSTFARRLSGVAGVPYLVKDTFKIALCNSISVGDREESSRFSAVTFDGMLYVAERMMEAGFPLIMEGNFVPSGVKSTDEAGAIKALLEKYRCRSLTFRFTGDTQVLHKRFVRREKLPERGEVNRMNGDVLYGDFNRWCRNLDPFHIGGQTVVVDTTDFNAVDFEGLMETARAFLRGR